MNPKRLLLVMLLPLFFLSVVAQDKVVTGRITDASGVPLAGASVMVKGTTTGTQTNNEGRFSLRVASSATTLVISSVGYAQQEVMIGSGPVNVSLQQVAANLNEVVVVGYGTQRKRDLTGAVATVTSKEFQTGAIQTPEQLIAGKVAGVQISQNSGAPGTGSRIRVRGGASLNASNDPLIVIDGVPVDNGGVSGSSNPLNLLNPDDIESFNILKDPSAAAIYGSRGSNGVILITTKKGRRGQPQYTFNAQVFSQTPAKKVDVLTAQQIKDIVTAKGGTEPAKLSTANTDWQDAIFRTAYGQDLNFSTSGATLDGKLPYRVSAGVLYQDGILKTSSFNRQTLSFNLSPTLFKDKLKVNFNMKLAHTGNRFADEGAIGSAISFDPTQPIYSGSNRFGGFFEYLEPSNVVGTGGFIPKDLAPRNPLALLQMRNNRSDVWRMLTNLQLDYAVPFIKGLRANLNIGRDEQAGGGTDMVSDSAGAFYRRYNIGKTKNGLRDSIYNYGGQNNKYESFQINNVLDFYLNYVKEVKSIKSRIDVMAGYGYQDFEFINHNFADYRYDGSVRPGTQPAFPVDYPRFTLISYYGRLNYTVANRYILTVNMRTDGSSKFNPEGRWGFFPSAALAWRIKEESFLANSNVVSDLKLRGSYGITGQQAGFGFYEFIPRYSNSGTAAQYQLGNTFLTMTRPAAYDPNLKWETTENMGIGLDFGFFKNRLTGSVDVFRRKTRDLLSYVPVALGTNFSNFLTTNVGNVESEGFEITLNATPVETKDFSWNFSVNFSYVEPKITKLLFNPDPSFKGVIVGGINGGTGNSIQIHAVDNMPNAFYVYQQVYDANGKPIEGVYEDRNRDGIINDDDKYMYKSPNPTFFGGFTSTFSYKKWTLGFVLRGNFDNYMYNNVASNLGVERGIFNPLGWINNGSSNYLETGFKNNQYFSDYYVQNASFVRMDNISVSYDAGKVYKQTRLRLSANVQNAFVITKYKGLDPEINGGIDNQFYPRPRIFTLGLNLQF